MMVPIRLLDLGRVTGPSCQVILEQSTILHGLAGPTLGQSSDVQIFAGSGKFFVLLPG